MGNEGKLAPKKKEKGVRLFLYDMNLPRRRVYKKKGKNQETADLPLSFLLK